MAAGDLKAAASYYAKALRQLSHNLKDDQLWKDCVNIPAAFLLGIYEVRTPWGDISQVLTLCIVGRLQRRTRLCQARRGGW